MFPCIIGTGGFLFWRPRPGGFFPRFPGGHYSYVTVANGFIISSGQLPITPEGIKLQEASFGDQAQQALANVNGALEAAGSDINHVIQIRVYIDNVGNWPEFDRLYERWAGQSRLE